MSPRAKAKVAVAPVRHEASITEFRKDVATYTDVVHVVSGGVEVGRWVPACAKDDVTRDVTLSNAGVTRDVPVTRMPTEPDAIREMHRRQSAVLAKAFPQKQRG